MTSARAGNSRLGALVLVLVLVATACAVAEASSGAQGADADASRNDTVAELPLASLAVLVTPDQDTQVRIESSIEQCMTSAGFAYERTGSHEIELVDLETRYGVYDPAVVGERWHRHAGEEQQPVHGGANTATVSLDAQERAAWNATYFGDRVVRIDLGDVAVERSAGGCLEEGWIAGYGDVDAWIEAFYRTQNLLGESLAEAAGDPVVRDALSRWSECMRSEGFSVEDREELAALPASETRAVADASCNAGSGLAAVWNGVEIEIQARMLDQHGELIEELLSRTSVGR